jgi:hypothetical protein
MAMVGVEVEEIDAAYGFVVVVDGHEAKLTGGVDVAGGGIVDELLEGVARERLVGSAVYPERSVVLPAVDGVDVIGLHRAQADNWLMRIHVLGNDGGDFLLCRE